MSQYHSPDGVDGSCFITSNMFSRRIGPIFGMLSHREGLSASAGLSCQPSGKEMDLAYSGALGSHKGSVVTNTMCLVFKYSAKYSTKMRI